jgi:Xaa-Pro aminopeptidase
VAVYTAHDGLPPHGLIVVLAKTLSELGMEKSRIGIDLASMTQSFMEDLQQTLPKVEWVPVDDVWRALRAVKTDAEVRLLEEAARQADRAMVSALNHMEGCAHDALSYSLWEFTERIRVHVGEFAGSASGHLATLQGADMRIYSKPPRGVFVTGNPVRAEATNHHFGYWGDTARTFFIGQPPQEFARAFQDNISLKRTALELFRPGAACSEIYDSVDQTARRAGIDLWREPGLGHGVGTCEREAPYLCPRDTTVLQPGMVLVLAIYTHGPRGELICSKDTYQITQEGYRLLSWYRNWDSKLYRVMGSTARHG